MPADTFVFNSSTDTVTYDLGNIDTVSIARRLFTTTSVTVPLALAVVEPVHNAIRLNNLDRLMFSGLSNISALVDDLVFA